MTEQASVNEEEMEPVSKRTRRSGVVASIGDPTLKDRSKVAPLFLTKKEKLEKQYKKEQDKLAQSTKTRLNDWKSVIGVERDLNKVCPVFQKASIASSSQADADLKQQARKASIIHEVTPIDPLPPTGIFPDHSFKRYSAPDSELTTRVISLATSLEASETEADRILHSCVNIEPRAITPHKVAPTLELNLSKGSQEYPDIDKPLQAACISALTEMSTGKQSPSVVTEWTPASSRDWCAARLEPRKQHALTKWLSKWKDEDTAVRRNRVAPILLVSGPTGCGKTALVYAAAAELNIQVLEVSPADFSWQSNGKRPMSEAVREALQSRQVKNEGAASQIVLIDDADVLVKEDRSVLTAIASMTDDSKRPLVLTCTNSDLITNSSVLELTHSFQIDPVDHLTSSFLIHAYSVVLATHTPGHAIVPRSAADHLAKYLGSDLGRIAMAAELSRVCDDQTKPLLPSCVFPINLCSDTVRNAYGLIRILNSIDGLPLRLRNRVNAQQKDVLDIIYDAHIDESNTSIDALKMFMSDLSVASLEGVEDTIGVSIALESMRSRFNSNNYDRLVDSFRAALAIDHQPTIQDPKSLVLPFLTKKEGFYVCNNRKRLGTTLNYLGRMAQFSNASEFSTRRVRCILDQFTGALSEVQQIRAIFR